jgi:hypothetical protein
MKPVVERSRNHLLNESGIVFLFSGQLYLGGKSINGETIDVSTFYIKV